MHLPTPGYFSPKLQAHIFKHLPDLFICARKPITSQQFQNKNSLHIALQLQKMIVPPDLAAAVNCTAGPAIIAYVTVNGFPFLFPAHCFSCQSWSFCLLIVWSRLLNLLFGLLQSPLDWTSWTSFPLVCCLCHWLFPINCFFWHNFPYVSYHQHI